MRIEIDSIDIWYDAKPPYQCYVCGQTVSVGVRSYQPLVSLISNAMVYKHTMTIRCNPCEDKRRRRVLGLYALRDIDWKNKAGYVPMSDVYEAFVQSEAPQFVSSWQ